MLFFSSDGKVYKLKAYQIPEGSRYSAGKYVYNLIKAKDITSWMSVADFESDYLMMLTAKGMVKKTPLSEFKNIRSDGIIAIALKEGDRLVEVRKTNGEQEVVVVTKKGMAIRFNEKEVRPMGRNTQGVIGIRLREGDEVVGSAVCSAPYLLTITTKGYGKRTPLEEYRTQGRGGYGIINIKTGEKTGEVVGSRAVSEEEELIILTTKGTSIRIPVKDIGVIGRNTQGVRLIKLKEGEEVAGFSVIRK